MFIRAQPVGQNKIISKNEEKKQPFDILPTLKQLLA